jgi:hypothetical protein
VEGQWGVSPRADTGPLLAALQEHASLCRKEYTAVLSIVKWKSETATRINPSNSLFQVHDRLYTVTTLCTEGIIYSSE